MGVGDWLSDKGSMLLGKAPKAILFVQKRSTSTVASLEGTAGNDINNSVAALRSLAKQKKAKSVASRMSKNAGQVIGVDELDAQFASDAEREAETALCMAEKNFLKFQVQYNPNSISFSTSAGRQKDFKAVGDGGAQQLITIERKATTFMSVKLVFEDVNVWDSFIRENLNMNAGNIKEAAADGLTKLAGGYSIKEKMEGLLSLLISNKTRNVVFVWADMFFHGQLNNVDANYTMFNKKGEPVRGEISLSIRQAASSQQYATDLEYWNEAFKAGFTDRTIGSDIAGGFSGGEAGVSEGVSNAVNSLLS